MNQTIALIGPPLGLVEVAATLGIEVLVIDTRLALIPGVEALADHLILIDYPHADDARLAVAVESILGGPPSLGYLALTEAGQLPAARLNACIEFSDNAPEAVERVVRKDLMRRRLARVCPQHSVASVVIHNRDQLEEFLADARGDMVLKPIAGSGSQGITVGSAVRIRSGWTHGPMLLEQRAVGQEFSVEAVSVAGAHQILGVTSKYLAPDSAVEIGHAFPAEVDPTRRERIVGAVRAVLDGLDIGWGLTHTEVIDDGQRSTVIETHCRQGGDRIADLIQLATGIDPYTLAILVRLQPDDVQDIESECGSRPWQHAAVAFRTGTPGTVRRVHTPRLAHLQPGTVSLVTSVAVGAVVGRTRSSLDRLAHAVAVGPDPVEAYRRARHAVAQIQIDLDVAPTPITQIRVGP